MGFKCGIIGLPNVGKSTLFNALTKADIDAVNFPFCTIEPNTRVVAMPDHRINQLSQIIKPKRVLPTTMEFVDIAGLVKGASQGEGLGNLFLTHIRETEAICHVVRCFDNEDIIHVANQVNPLADINTINTELALADLATCKRAIHRIQKKNNSSDTNIEIKLNVLTKCLSHLENAMMLRNLSFTKEEKAAIKYLNFLTLKPTMYIANVSEDNFNNNTYIDEIRTFTEKENSVVIPICAAIEADIAQLNENESNEFIKELGIQEPSLNCLIRNGYQLLNLQTYFTVGIKEVRAWTIPVGFTAPQAAGKIHTDFEKGFIRAKTISFTDFINYGGEQGVKEAGKIRIEGKNYIVQDGDVMNFLFNV